MWLRLAFALAALGAIAGGDVLKRVVVRRSRAVSPKAPAGAESTVAPRWRDLLAEYGRGGGGAWGSFLPPLPLDGQAGAAHVSPLALLVLPVPVAVDAGQGAGDLRREPSRGGSPSADPEAASGRRKAPERISAAEGPEQFPKFDAPLRPDSREHYFREAGATGDTREERPATGANATRGRPRARGAPAFEPVGDTDLLVRQFRDQVRTDIHLPPIVLRPDSSEEVDPEAVGASDGFDVGGEPEASGGSTAKRSCRSALPAKGGFADDAKSPPPLAFDRSVMLRARLTVPRAGYTEPYTLWWDAASGASRVDFHGGAASSYRLMSVDGLTQTVAVREDRSGPSPVRRCVLAEPRRASVAERALPALPDLQQFVFDGRVQVRGGEAERWRLRAEGHPGEGGVRGEVLTFHHELLVKRLDNFTSAPLRYSVSADSSMLGSDFEGYVHRFYEVRFTHHDPSVFRLDVEEACDRVERVPAGSPAADPLREYTRLRRDPRYDGDHARYRNAHGRRYADDAEEAVRKSLLIQSVRFVDSGNREGASFEMEAGFLADRLLSERARLLGAREASAATRGATPFPHSRRDLAARRPRLPRAFDWRERGAVTHVRNQGLCASCWAFAVVGAVEGALFQRTGRLVPLSEQTLVDCAQPYGGRGCGGTWPTSAYDYAQDRGLPALGDYEAYHGEVGRCSADSVPPVTHISGHYNVTRGNIVALKTAIRQYAPTVVIIDGQADSFALYKKGYYSDERCRRDSRNHAVLAVGWSLHEGQSYFTLKNSWSEAWGEAGYVRLRGPGDTCGLLSRPSVPRLRASDVRRVPAAAPAADRPPEPPGDAQ